MLVSKRMVIWFGGGIDDDDDDLMRAYEYTIWWSVRTSLIWGVECCYEI